MAPARSSTCPSMHPSMHRLGLSACFALVSLMATSGCYHYQTRVPGVVDLRSDGSGAPSAPPKRLPSTTRSGLEGLLQGQGVKTVGSRVSIADRHFFLGIANCTPGAFLFSNKSSSEEISAAEDKEALRYVRLGHSFTVEDFLASFLVGFIPCSSCVQPVALTFTATGERIKLTGASGARMPPPIGEIPPPIAPLAPAPIVPRPQADNPPSRNDASAPDELSMQSESRSGNVDGKRASSSEEAAR